MEYEREGSDITAADMVLPQTDPSEIVEFYSNSTIFLTGVTGFLGGVFLEKLIRTCNDLNKIYVMIRAKKGKDEHHRLKELLEGPNFEPLRRKFPDFINKITVVKGDCSLPDLGLCEEDKQILIQEVNVVIHSAATVRFDEKLKFATYVNVRAVRDLIALAKQMKNLKAFLYISTAFSNCIRKQIDESFYDPPISGDKLLSLVELIDDHKLESVTATLIGNYPNTYVFTKAVAEDIVRNEGATLPVGIFRPAIVIASVKEPVAGWIDNIYSATGVMIGAALGLLRCMQGRKNNRAEMVPVDYVTNSALAAAWDVASIKTLNDNQQVRDGTSREDRLESQIPIYNFVSHPENGITWDEYNKLAEKHAVQVPTELIIWRHFFVMLPHKLQLTIALFFLHTVPAYLIDFLCLCIGKKPQMVQGYKKINKFSNVLAYFCMREWEFKNNNVQSLWKRMKEQDQELFEFNMGALNWDSYFYTYVRGARVYVLKDPLNTVDKGKRKYYKVMLAHYTLLGVLSLILYSFIMYLVKFLF